MLQKLDVLDSEQQDIYIYICYNASKIGCSGFGTAGYIYICNNASKIGCSSFGTALNIFVTLL